MLKFYQRINYLIGMLLIKILGSNNLDKCFLIYFRIKAKNIANSKKYYIAPRLLWGSTPLINNKYWSEAMQEIGFTSKTFIYGKPYSINENRDFDYYFDGFNQFEMYKLIINICENFDIIHMPFTGFIPESRAILKKHEYELFKTCGLKLVFIPYGGDAYLYSRIFNYSRKYALIYHYGKSGKDEYKIKKQINKATENGDCIIGIPEGFSYWDIFSLNVLSINLIDWNPTIVKHFANGINSPVVIVHSPNHRKIKGTEFIIKAVNELKQEGLQIEFLLLEGMKNSRVKQALERADILVDQILKGYGLNLVEGMAMKAAVISNLEGDEIPIKVYRRYSFLNECPALNATPENIKEQLKTLILNPALRNELGDAGRQYVEKYHSYQTTQYMFSSIYDKIWYGKEFKLLDMFDPNEPRSYNNQSPIIEHPLVENKIPAELMATLKKE